MSDQDPSLDEGDIAAVPCRECGAQVGEPCTDSRPDQYHLTRFEDMLGARRAMLSLIINAWP